MTDPWVRGAWVHSRDMAQVEHEGRNTGRTDPLVKTLVEIALLYLFCILLLSYANKALQSSRASLSNSVFAGHDSLSGVLIAQFGSFLHLCFLYSIAQQFNYG